jgi:hypothetical protein
MERNAAVHSNSLLPRDIATADMVVIVGRNYVAAGFNAVISLHHEWNRALVIRDYRSNGIDSCGLISRCEARVTINSEERRCINWQHLWALIRIKLGQPKILPMVLSTAST